MFQGSIPADLRALYAELIRGWDAEDVWVGCSGNFTIERVCATLPKPPRTHGNDVGLYSCVLGAYFTGADFRLELAEQWKGDLAFMEPFMESVEDAAATVMLCSASPGPLTKLGSPNHYYERMRHGFRAQWEQLHAKTVEKLRAGREATALTSFTSVDLVDQEQLVDGPFVCFPPFDTGGYETQFKMLAEAFDWDEPEYEVFDDERHALLLERLPQRSHWLYANNQRREELEPFLRGKVQQTARNQGIWVYAHGGALRKTSPRQKIEPVLVPHWDGGTAEKLSLAPLSPGQFAALRSQALNHNIAPGTAMLTLGVLVDGQIAGCFAYSPGKFDASEAYLMSDFALPGTPERASKLVVAAALSEEAQALMERVTSKRQSRVSTTAFSKHPASMKYRGLLKLDKREESSDPAFEYQLKYSSDAGRWTLDDALAAWKAKHG